MANSDQHPTQSLPSGMEERKLLRLIVEMMRNQSRTEFDPSMTTKKPLIPYRDSQNYQRDALLYIVVVLFFYSVGLAICMIKYMRKEAEESRDSQFTQDVIQNSRRLAAQEEKLETARKLVTRLNQSPTLKQGRNMSFQLEVLNEKQPQNTQSHRSNFTPRISIQINDEDHLFTKSSIRRESHSANSSISSLNSSNGWEAGASRCPTTSVTTDAAALLSHTSKHLHRMASIETNTSEEDNNLLSRTHEEICDEEKTAFLPKKSVKKVAFSST